MKGVVFRLQLRHNGTVAHFELIKPARKGKTTPNMPVRNARAYHFGAELAGTPFANQVIISDYRANSPYAWNPRAGEGLVLLWHRHARSQLLTERTTIRHVAHSRIKQVSPASYFGEGIYLSTPIAAATGTSPKLYISAPSTETGPRRQGAVWAFRYTSDGYASLHHLREWTSRSRGIAGAPATSLGVSIGGYVARSGHPRILLGVPNHSSRGGFPGEVLVLGTGQSFGPKQLGIPHKDAWDFRLGGLISDWADRPDYLRHDPWRGGGPESSVRRVVTTGMGDVGIATSGLPLPGAPRLQHFGSEHGYDPLIALTSGSGGGTAGDIAWYW